MKSLKLFKKAVKIKPNKIEEANIYNGKYIYIYSRTGKKSQTYFKKREFLNFKDDDTCDRVSYLENKLTLKY